MVAGFVTEGTEEKKMHRKPRSPLKWASMGTLMCGIGIQLSSTVRAGGVQVLFVSKIAEGSPAEQHLSIHDVIEQVDDKDMRGLAVSSVLQHILGPTDAPVTLDINRGGERKRVIIMRQLNAHTSRELGRAGGHLESNASSHSPLSTSSNASGQPKMSTTVQSQEQSQPDSLRIPGVVSASRGKLDALYKKFTIAATTAAVSTAVERARWYSRLHTDTHTYR